jgi:hypothetical protein
VLLVSVECSSLGWSSRWLEAAIRPSFHGC